MVRQSGFISTDTVQRTAVNEIFHALCRNREVGRKIEPAAEIIIVKNACLQRSTAKEKSNNEWFGVLRCQKSAVEQSEHPEKMYTTVQAPAASRFYLRVLCF